MKFLLAEYVTLSKLKCFFFPVSAFFFSRMHTIMIETCSTVVILFNNLFYCIVGASGRRFLALGGIERDNCQSEMWRTLLGQWYSQIARPCFLLLKI